MADSTKSVQLATDDIGAEIIGLAREAIQEIILVSPYNHNLEDLITELKEARCRRHSLKIIR